MVDSGTPYGTPNVVGDLAGLRGSRDWLAILSL